jgi:hypothetical protein
VRGIVLSLGLLLLEVSSSLVAGVASEAANSILDSTSGGVDDGLESGRLGLVGHVEGVFVFGLCLVCVWFVFGLCLVCV